MKFPAYYQLESIDCGPTCIQMVAAYYGKKYPLSQLKAHCHVTRIGISVQDIVTGCKAVGLHAVPVQITLEEIQRMPLPAILYWQQEHFVVLYRIQKQKEKTVYFISDPAYGHIRLTEADFTDAWLGTHSTGIAIPLEPTPEFHDLPVPPPEPHEKGKIKALIRSVYGKNRLRMLAVLLLSLVGMATNWAIPVLFQRMIDDGIGGKDLHLLVLILGAQLAFFIGNMCSSTFVNILLTNLGFKTSVELLSVYITKLIRLPIAFFDTKLNTDLIQRMDDQQRVQEFLVNHLFDFVFAVLNLIVFSSILFYYDPSVFLIFLFFSTGSILWTRLFLAKRKLLDYSRFSILAESKNNIYDLLSGMAEIKINSAQEIKVAAWKRIQLKINQIGLKALYLTYYMATGSSFLSRLKDVLIIGFCASLVIKDQMTLGVLLGINYILGQLTTPLNQLLEFIRNAQDARLSYERLHEIQQRKEEDLSLPTLPAADLEAAFRFEHVSFKYEASFSPYVLNDITVEIPKGKVTAIVGASGSGKTTLLKLLLAFYYPQQGDLYLNNEKMCLLQADDWRKKCGVVMQDGYIFSGTIAENIALAESEADPERLKQAARIACIDEFIGRLPMRFHTKVGKSGIDLSGGQKQRILIARAVYRNPDFIFFDEATSSLDASNEREIMQRLKAFYRGKTVVVIAHRLSTVKDADKLLVLDKGYLVEEGTHADLTARKGIYYQLVKNQLELGQ